MPPSSVISTTSPGSDQWPSHSVAYAEPSGGFAQAATELTFVIGGFWPGL